MRNLRLDICYDGTRYKGWQRLATGDNTIQGKLETLLTRLLDEPIQVNGSGRTDAGTHALGQVVNFLCKNEMPCQEILSALRKYLPEDIGVYSCRDVSQRFHARLNARGKTYRYRIWNSDAPCVFDRRYVYADARQFDLESMRRGAKHFIGTHDFSAFCGNKHMKKSTQRCIDSLEIRSVGDELVFTISGNGFLQHMVRIIVGTLLEVGMHSRDADSIPALFGKGREQAGPTVPACGLCLMEVIY